MVGGCDRRGRGPGAVPFVIAVLGCFAVLAALAGEPDVPPVAVDRPVATADLPAEDPWRALVAGVWDRDLGGGLRLDRIVVRGHEVALVLHGPGGEEVGRVLLRHPDGRGHHAGDLAVATQAPFSQVRTPEQARIQAALATVIREVEARDPGDLGRQLSGPLRTQWLGPSVARLWLGAPLALLLAAGLVQLARRRELFKKPEIRANHLLPSVLQCTIYAYWAVYVSRVGERALDIAAQLVFAYALEALLSLGRGRPWRPGFAPVPVVLSTNLFVWFNEPWLQLGAITVALSSKELIQRRGAHIFNPSALGVSAIALPTLLLPAWFRWGTPTPDVEMNLPPNMAELILCLALVAQLRFPIAIVPLGALSGLTLLNRLGLHGPDPYWPATLLILVLFATDPKTLPTTVAGRGLYGLAFGVAIGLLSVRLVAVGHPDPYAKVLPIPVLNLLAPRLDRAGEALVAAWSGRSTRWRQVAGGAALLAVLFVVRGPVLPPLLLAAGAWWWWARGVEARPDAVMWLLGPDAHRVVVAIWFVTAALGISGGKAASFQARDHFENDTPRVVVGEPPFPSCADNPAWCRPFAVVDEVRAWAR